MLKGIPASQGYGIGKAMIIHDTTIDISSVRFTNIENEISRLNIAVDKYITSTDSNNEILQGHIAMLSDPFMLSEMHDSIKHGSTAEKSVDTICNKFIDMFSSVDDELTRQRATDIKDIRDNIIALLMNKKTIDFSSIPYGTIIVAKDLTPSMTSQMDKSKVMAIITEVGGITSHSAILSRSMGIPAVLCVDDATNKISPNENIIVDGFKGKIIQNPSESDIEKYNALRDDYINEKENLSALFGKRTKAKVYGNISNCDDAQTVIQNDGEGVGLFRTEFLFMNRNTPPNEEEQFEAYSTVARAMNGKEVIIRTLDIGGDKEIGYLKIEKEDNPFLGHRAIRYCLDNPLIFKTQIRAILRASQFGNIKIMLPLITNIDEVRKAKAIIDECDLELKAELIEHKKVQIGIMVETPAAVITCDLLAKEVDFFSIGTNDLIGYTMAVDRGNPKLLSLYDPTHEAILRSIEHVIKTAKKNGISVGMCGEVASDERIIPKLVEWGLDEFSVSPSAILQTRKEIINCKIES